MMGKVACLKVQNNFQVSVSVLLLCSTNMESCGALAGINTHRWIHLTCFMAQTLLQARQWSVMDASENSCRLCITAWHR